MLLLIGNFGYLTNQLDGQTVKTRNIRKLIEKKYEGNCYFFDTSYVKRNPLLLFNMFFFAAKCNKVIVVPADGFLANLFSLVYYITRIFGNNLIHIGVGGWQKEFFAGQEGKFAPHPTIMKQCMRITTFMVEIAKVKNDLQNELGFKNLEYFPNFRFFNYLPKYECVPNHIRLVYMGRINQMKGYETMGGVMCELSNRGINATLDFYGQVEECDREHFKKIINSNSHIEYKGILSPEDIYETLGHYDIMVFPTRYYTEGFPGTVLDANIAGIPVIATNWKHSHEFIEDKKSGFIVDFDNPVQGFVDSIETLYYNTEALQKMKHEAHNESNKYSEDSAWRILSKYLK
jgi:glycosyltransferase involved in cell wall biosynthesis